MNSDKLRYLFAVIALVLFSLGMFFAATNQRKQLKSVPVILKPKKNINDTPNLNRTKKKSTITSETTYNSQSSTASSNTNNLLSSNNASAPATPLPELYPRTRLKKDNAANVSIGIADDLMSLRAFVKRIENKWGIKINLLYEKDININLDIEKSQLENVIRALAHQLDLPLIGAIDTLVNGSCKNIFITDQALYIGDDEKIPESLSSFLNSDEIIRHNAYVYLTELNDSNISPYFTGIYLRTDDTALQNDALIYMKKNQSPESVNELVTALSDTSVERRERARRALEEIGGELVLQRLITEKDIIKHPDILEIINQMIEKISQTGSQSTPN